MSSCADFTVELGGERLDKFLASRLPDLSRSRLQQLIAEGLVTVNGLPARASARTRAGQRIAVTIPAAVPSELEPQAIPLNVVFEDPDLLVVDKPAGLTVHPGPGHPDRTIVNAVLALVPDLKGIGGTLRPGIVHRLDKDTSGLLVIAKSETAHAALSCQFKERQVTKAYLALVQGRPEPPEATIDGPIGRHPKDRKRMAVVTTGREATTTYRTLQRFDKHALIEARPTSGRTHQIRVHLASVGHPLVGDAVYGRPHPVLNRHFLHAHLLGFRLPSTGERVELRSDLPPDLRAMLDSL